MDRARSHRVERAHAALFTTGNPELSRRVAESTRLFALAVSFGSVGSSIGLPCHIPHASIPEAFTATGNSGELACTGAFLVW
jgi:cystathionine beta-lyase/cystathionine gamma-synthase